jgi:hypothetical protein
MAGTDISCSQEFTSAHIAQDFPYVVDGGKDADKPPTLVESPRDLGKVVRGYGQDPDELVGYFADIAANVLG